MPAAVDVQQVFHSVLFENLQSMSTSEPLADRPHVATVLLEHDEVILRMIGDEVDAPVAPLSQRMRIDHRSDRGIGLGPFHVHAIAGRTMTDGHAIGRGGSFLSCRMGSEKDETGGKESEDAGGHDFKSYGPAAALQSAHATIRRHWAEFAPKACA